jgi:hypothetical protein
MRPLVVRLLNVGSWLATVVLLAGYGWLIAGGVLRLVADYHGAESHRVPYLPHYPALDPPGVIITVLIFTGLAACQLLAVVGRVFWCGLVIGLLFASVGTLGVLVVGINLAMPGQGGGEFDPLYHGVIPVAFIALSLMIGMSMLVSAYHPGRRPARPRAKESGDKAWVGVAEKVATLPAEEVAQVLEEAGLRGIDPREFRQAAVALIAYAADATDSKPVKP